MSPSRTEPSASVPQVTLDQRSTQIGQSTESSPKLESCRQRVEVEEVVVVILCTTTSSTSPISASRQDSFHVDQSISQSPVSDPNSVLLSIQHLNVGVYT